MKTGIFFCNLLHTIAEPFGIIILLSWDSSVGLATGRRAGVLFPAGAKIFFYTLNPASYPMDKGWSFPGGKAARA
jgi:hypothetical protein